MKKIINKVINYIKENYVFILACIITVFVGLYKLPYNLYTGGGIININTKVEVSDAYKADGSFYMAYVKQARATIPTYLLSYVFGWDRAEVADSLIDENDTPDDLWDRERLYMEEANTSALISAFRLANKNIEITKEKTIVLYLVNEAKTDLKIGDEIINVDGKVVHDTSDLSDIVNQHKIGDKIDIKIRRNNKERDCYAEVIEIDNSLKIGIALIRNYEYKIDNDVKFKFSNNEAGSSGGLMLTLEIYNQLVPEDITKGYKIAGTGTIDYEGKVGKIGGVKYKLKGAEKNKVKVFFVPSGNYEEAKKEKEEHNYKIDVVKVEKVEDAINYLKGMK